MRNIRKLGTILTLSLGLLSASAAMANDAVVGALIGGGAGVLVGQSVGGRNGAIIGGALGAATGAAIASDDDNYRPRHRVPYVAPAPVYYTEQAYYAPPPVRVVQQPVYYVNETRYYDKPRHHDHRRDRHGHRRDWDDRDYRY